MTQLFYGFGVHGYRSFGNKLEYFGPLRKVNLIAGQNNSGKSNVISYLVRHLKDHRTWTPKDLDRPRMSDATPLFGYALALPPIEQLLDEIPNLAAGNKTALAQLLQSSTFEAPDEIPGLWLRYTQQEANGGTSYDPKQLEELYGERSRLASRLQQLSSAMTSMSGGGQYGDGIRVLDVIAQQLKIPPVRLIESFRQIAPLTDSSKNPPAGQGLIDIIDQLQNPEAIDQPGAEQKYRALNSFVSDVFDERGMRLEVPSSRKTINVRTRNNVVLPLENQGAGVHQVIIIAALATTYENTLVCIEEPEVNLHPILQRRLLRYLANNTSNQYVIATHSAQMLDYERANVFHLTPTPSGTRITPATTPAQVARICVDLGYKPSDLLQSNAIIWVEGPSDRTYLNYWIRQVDKRLEEGIHYSVMFYGGSLLKELTAEDPAISEFINLRRLNRNVAILIDSDRSYAGRPLNSTKKRVIGELASTEENSFVWVTHGYTIENYIPPDILSEAIRSAHPNKGRNPKVTSDRWTNPLAAIDSPDKPKIAKKVVELSPNSLAESALKKKVEELVRFIRRANVGFVMDSETEHLSSTLRGRETDTLH